MANSDSQHQQSLSFFSNPANGATLYVAAGGQIDVEFDFANDSPDVAAFCLDCEGIPDARWLTGTGRQFEVAAAALGGGTLRLTFHPTIDSSPGDYPFNLRILSGSVVIGPQMTLTLRVGPAERRPPPPVPEPEPLPAPPSVPDAGAGQGQASWPNPAAQAANPSPSAWTPPPAAAPPNAPVWTPPGEPQPAGTPPQEFQQSTQPAWTAPPAAAPQQPAWTPPPAAAPPPPAWTPPPGTPPPAAAPQQPAWTPPSAAAPPPPAWTPPPAAAPQQPAWTPPPAATPPPPAWTPPPAATPTPPAWTPPPAAAPPPPAWNPPPAAAPPPPAWNPPPPAAPQQPAWNPPPAAAPQQPAWNPPPAAQQEQLHMVDLTRPEAEAEPQQETAPQEPREPSIVSPRNGSVLTVRPGESLLVRFPFTNTTPTAKTYMLDEDRSMPSTWITLVQDQVNISRNAEGELSFRLTPPIEAEAGEYPFSVNVGPQGGTITNYSLILQVPVVPAVRLTSKSPKVTIGPVGHIGDIQFAAEISGNADTAFRVAAKSREAGQEVHDVYESGQWRYIFDKELETLEAPNASHPAMPVPLRLRVERRGTWWFGFRESHTIHVEAVPVTEPGNGGKTGNTIDLKITRWRLLPIPLGLFLPLLLVLIILGSGGTRTLVATNAVVDEDGGYWAVLPPGDQKAATLQWSADRLAMLNLTSKVGDTQQPGHFFVGSGSFTDHVALSNDNRIESRQYRVGRVLGGGDQEITVSYIYTRGDSPLLAYDGSTKKPLYGPEATLVVPDNGFARLILKNGSPQFTRIDWWLADRLDTDDPYQFLYSKTSGSIEPGGTEEFLIERRPGFPKQDFNIMFITTDQSRPSFTVYLKPQ